MIQFQVKKSVLKIGKQKGQTMYVARQVSHDRLTPDAVEARIERMTTLSRADVRAAILALSVIIEEEIKLGRAVDLRELGTFKIVASARYQTDAKQVNALTLRTPHVRFYPKLSMRQAAREVELEVVHPEKPVRKRPGSGLPPKEKEQSGGGPGKSQSGKPGGAGDDHLGI